MDLKVADALQCHLLLRPALREYLLAMRELGLRDLEILRRLSGMNDLSEVYNVSD